MKITTLVENHPHSTYRELKSEHGVSFYIELGGHVYMSDVGQSDKFAENAAKLNIDLGKVEVLAISHHHYDHGGGLGRFIKENEMARIFLRKSNNADYIASIAGIQVKYIGLDRGLLKQNEDRIIYIKSNQEVAPGFHLITDISQEYPKPHGDNRLKMRIDGKSEIDTFTHEMVTVVEDANGIVIMTGCAHNGVLNMIAAAQNAFPDKPIKAVIGGFHLNHEDDGTVREIGKALLDMSVPLIFTGHCTGDHQTDILEDVLGDRLQRLFTGQVISL